MRKERANALMKKGKTEWSLEGGRNRARDTVKKGEKERWKMVNAQKKYEKQSKERMNK